MASSHKAGIKLSFPPLMDAFCRMHVYKRRNSFWIDGQLLDDGVIMTDRNFKNAHLTETVVVSGSVSEVVIASLQEDYALNEADYIRLTSEWNSLKGWSVNFFFVTLGYAMSLAPSFFPRNGAIEAMPSNGEVIVLCTSSAITILFYAIGSFIPNERKTLLKRIGNHFKNAPRSRHVMRNDK